MLIKQFHGQMEYSKTTLGQWGENDDKRCPLWWQGCYPPVQQEVQIALATSSGMNHIKNCYSRSYI